VGITLGVSSLACAQSSAARSVAAQDETSNSKMHEAYKKWLDEDVRWIVTKEETEQFVKLSTDEERNQFIKQFWERREEQVANGAKTDFRGEYYRRIAYANQHFAAGIPGWKSDRGRIYIVYGQPDSIDSHPGGIGDVKPWEVWHYNSIQEYSPSLQESQGDKAMTVAKKDVDLKFIDTCNCGNYQLQVGRSEVVTTIRAW
jgi:GWxTD domain-containing protein